MSAIAGLARGFASGAKLRSELDDAKERRGLMAMQKQQAQLQLDQGNEQAEARRFAAGLITGYAGGDEALGFVRNEDGSYDPNDPRNLSRYYDMSEQSAQRLALANNQNPQEAIAKVRELRSKGFQEGVNMAAGLYGLGDFAGGDAALKRVYPMIRDGQTFLGSAPVEGDPEKVALRYRVDETGEEREMITGRGELSNRLLPLAMNITDAANFNLNREKLEQTRTEFAALQDYRRAQLELEDKKLDLDGRKTDGLLKYYSQMGAAAITKANADNKSIDLQRTTQALNNQLGSVTTLLGIKKDFDPSRATDDEIRDHQNKLQLANTAMFLVNQGIQKNDLTIDATRAIQLAQAADTVPFSEIKRAGPNMFFTQIDGIRVPVAMTEGQYNQLRKANEPKTEQPAKPGIATPPAPPAQRSGRGIRTQPDPAQVAAALDAKMAEYQGLEGKSDRRSASRRATLERELKAAGRL